MRTSLARFWVSILGAAILFSGRASAATRIWGVPAGQSGDWSIGSNWSLRAPPNSGDYAYINSGNATITLPGATCSRLFLGGIGATGGVTMTGGNLSSGSQCIGNGGTGSFAQSGGANAISGPLFVGYQSYGSYSLSGSGQLSAGTATIGDLAPGTFSQTGGTQSVTNLYVPYGTYNISGVALASATNAYIGGAGEGSVNQTGGTQTITNLDVAYGSYNLGGNGLLLSSYAGVSGFEDPSYPFLPPGGPASFNQTGGTHSVANLLSIGYDAGASYNLSGNALLSAGTIELDGGGGGFVSTFSHSAAARVVANLLEVNGAIYNLGGSAALSANALVDVGSVIQSGGTNAVATSIYLGNAPFGGVIGDQWYGPGVYSLSGNALLSSSNMYLGYGQGMGGQFSQSGGTNAVGNLYVGYSPYGTAVSNYTLAGSALLSASNTYLVLGTFTQSGGTHAVANGVDVGWSNYYRTSNASYAISGDSLLTARWVDVGYSANGTMTQSGGTVALTQALNVGGGDGPYGIYNFNGGELVLAGLSVSQGPAADLGYAAFNFNGGTIQAGASFSSSASLSLDNPGGNATIDTAGYTVTLSGNLAGPGNLIKTGAGKLVLSGTNSYSGGTTVSGGELIVAESQAILNGSNLIVGNAAAFAPLVAADAPPGGSPPSRVPEPCTLALVASAAICLAAFGLRRRRRRKLRERHMPSNASALAASQSAGQGPI